MYRSVSGYYREKFGCKVYKLSLSGGMTCPNRDGAKGVGGCIFCSLRGSGDFAAPARGDVSAQLAAAKEKVAFKAKNAKFIAYFQDYTNTYAPTEYLEPLFRQAMAPAEVVGLAVATRPDCLPPETVALLEELNREKPVTVELGLQTIHPATAAYIRRGYPLSDYDSAVRRLKAAGLEVVVHMILGLPGETADMTVETARYIGASGADGIKLQLLHVLRGTDLAKDYSAGRFSTLTMEEYFDLLDRCLAVLPPRMVIHRLTGDGPKRDLIAPLWSGEKKTVLRGMNQYFLQHGTCQGRALWENGGTNVL